MSKISKDGKLGIPIVYPYILLSKDGTNLNIWYAMEKIVGTSIGKQKIRDEDRELALQQAFNYTSEMNKNEYEYIDIDANDIYWDIEKKMLRLIDAGFYGNSSNGDGFYVYEKGKSIGDAYGYIADLIQT